MDRRDLLVKSLPREQEKVNNKGLRINNSSSPQMLTSNKEKLDKTNKLILSNNNNKETKQLPNNKRTKHLPNNNNK